VSDPRRGRPTGQHYFRRGAQAKRMKARLQEIALLHARKALGYGRELDQPDADVPVPAQEGDIHHRKD